LDDENRPVFSGNFLDGATLASLTGDTGTYFNLVDFKITP